MWCSWVCGFCSMVWHCLPPLFIPMRSEKWGEGEMWRQECCKVSWKCNYEWCGKWCRGIGGARKRMMWQSTRSKYHLEMMLLIISLWKACKFSTKAIFSLCNMPQIWRMTAEGVSWGESSKRGHVYQSNLVAFVVTKHCGQVLQLVGTALFHQWNADAIVASLDGASKWLLEQWELQWQWQCG